MTPQLTTLDNGVRVASLTMPGVQSVSIGLWADAGSRHESARLNGISHFLEHLLFKGTTRRRARQISESIEGLGGDINAHTSEERTCFYAAAPAAHLPKVADVLFDLFSDPRLASRDIELERGVIGEEILMYRDEPDQHVHEMLSGIFWPGHPLGRPIAGTLETIARFQQEDFLRYRCVHHHAGNTLVAAAGALDHSKLVRLTEQFLVPPAPRKKSGPATTPPEVPQKVEVLYERRETSQTHVSLGLPAPGCLTPDRHAIALLIVMLGGNSSSRLFQELRERRGWCYSVSASGEAFRDTGMLNISIGLDGNHLEKCLGVILKIFEEFREKPCREQVLRRAKEYLIGSGRMSLERTGSQATRLAQSLFVMGRFVSVEESENNIRSVTVEDIQEAARKYLRPDLAKLALIGPAANPTLIAEILASAKPREL